MIAPPTTFVDRSLAERPIAERPAHPDIERFRRQRANRAGHTCRECRRPACVGEARDAHEMDFAQAESSALLDGQAYFACPGCGGDVRTAPACRLVGA